MTLELFRVRVGLVTGLAVESAGFSLLGLGGTVVHLLVASKMKLTAEDFITLVTCEGLQKKLHFHICCQPLKQCSGNDLLSFTCTLSNCMDTDLTVSSG